MICGIGRSFPSIGTVALTWIPTRRRSKKAQSHLSACGHRPASGLAPDWRSSVRRYFCHANVNVMPSEGPKSRVAEKTARLKVLVIDDDSIARELLCATL